LLLRAIRFLAGSATKTPRIPFVAFLFVQEVFAVRMGMTGMPWARRKLSQKMFLQRQYPGFF